MCVSTFFDLKYVRPNFKEMENNFATCVAEMMANGLTINITPDNHQYVLFEEYKKFHKLQFWNVLHQRSKHS